MALTRNSSANSPRASTTFASIAPAARARARISSHGSSACWPTSTARATTSAPHSSWIHFTATDVSSPPEYASTTRLVISSHLLDCLARCGPGYPDRGHSLGCFAESSFSQSRQGGEVGGYRATAGRRRTHQDDRVVARHRAEDVA